MRTGILQNENILGINLEALIIDTRGKVFKRRKYDRAAFELKKIGVRGGALEDRTLRCQVSEQRDQAAFGLKGLFPFGDDGSINPPGIFVLESVAKRFARHCHA